MLANRLFVVAGLECGRPLLVIQIAVHAGIIVIANAIPKPEGYAPDVDI